jgi:superfamily II DNA or RNA helicase
MSSKNPLSIKIINAGIFNNLSSFCELENRIEKVCSLNNRPINSTKGDVFEIFIEALLNINNKYKSNEVYPSGKIPLKLNQVLELNINEKGHDGVYKKDNELACYQVKYRKSENLTWDELSTFIGVSEKADIRHLFTNCSNISKEFLNKSKVRVTTRQDLLNLKKQEFQEIEGWLRNKKIQLEKHVPEKYQNEAINDIFNDLKFNNRTTAIMACGSGKTDVGLWVYERINPNLCVVFVPSIALVKQVRSDWLEQITNKDIKTIQVCSAKHKTDREDSIILNEIDLDFKITLNEETIKKFVNQNKNLKKIIFSTYQSSDVLARSLKRIKVDFAVFDEAHRTATIRKLNQSKISNFQLPLLNENIFIKKRLFMTATRRISNKKKVRKEGDSKLSLSMDNEYFYGKISHNLSFYKAMKLGCIAKFKIAYSVVTSDEVDTYKRKISATLVNKNKIKSEQVAKQIALKKVIKKLNIKKIFSFHRTVNRAKSFVANGPEGIGTHLPKFYCNHVDGTMKISDREKITETFKNSNFGILSNARCLIEGVDVPSVELVSFSDKKNSEIDIIQSAGRALRNRNINKKYGYLFVPIFVEKKKKEHIKDALARSNYELIVEILNAIKDHDTEIAQIITDYYTDDTKGYNDTKKRFEDLFEKEKDIISLDILNRAIKNKIKDRIITRWDFYLNQLKVFIKENKHSLTPIVNLKKKKLNEKEKFFQWVHNIKLRKRKDDLMNYQIEELEKIGINWKIKGETINSSDGLISARNIILKYFWGKSAIDNKILENNARYYSGGGLADYYEPKEVNKIKKKLNNLVSSNDKSTVSLNQIIDALNMKSAKIKGRTNSISIIKKWIKKTNIEYCGKKFAQSKNKGNFINVYPKNIIKIIIEQNKIIDEKLLDNKNYFSYTTLNSDFLFKKEFIEKNFKCCGISVFNRITNVYSYEDNKKHIDRYYKFKKFESDKKFLKKQQSIEEFNLPLDKINFLKKFKIKEYKVDTPNMSFYYYLKISDLKKTKKNYDALYSFDEKKFIKFNEIDKAWNGNEKLVRKAFDRNMFKIKGYIYSKGASTSKYDAPPYIERNTKNLDIISRVKENITIPKNLVGLAYIKKKFNIEFKTIRLLIRKNKIQYDELRVSQQDVLSSLKDQPYFLKTTIKKQLKDLGYI